MIDQKNTLAELLTTKKELLRLFGLATVVAFSVGVLASLVAAQTTVPTTYIFAGALATTIAALGLLALDLKANLSFEEEFEGVLFLDVGSNEAIEVKGYELSKDIARVLRAVKAESRSIYSEWEKSPLVQKKTAKPTTEETGKRKSEQSYIGIYKVTVDKEREAVPAAVRLLNEAVLFVLLEELSTHLSTYFNNSDGEHVAEIRREDIPAFLLSNRVLNLLTTPIEQRDVFMSAFPDEKKRPDGELVSLWGSDGAMYSRFDLTLPKQSRVTHTDSGSVRIETKRMTLEVSGGYIGSSAVVSRTFMNHYMGTSSENIECRKIAVELRGRIKPFALLSSKGWEHYRWLDSFRTRLKNSVDFETFLGNMQWQTIEPVLYSLRGQFASIRRQIDKDRSATSDA